MGATGDYFNTRYLGSEPSLGSVENGLIQFFLILRDRLPAQAGLMVGLMSSWYVYFLKSEERKWYYVGSTNRLEERVMEHNEGKVPSTKTHRPLKLVYQIRFYSEQEARMYEQKVKDMRKEKERIIREIGSIKYCGIV